MSPSHSSATSLFRSCQALTARVLLLAGLSMLTLKAGPIATGQEAVDPAARQYAIAVAAQNRLVYQQAADEWQKFIAQFPADPRLDRAFYYYGVSLLNLNKHAEAAAAFGTVLRSYPNSEMAQSCQLNLGMAQYGLAQRGKPETYDQAAATLAAFLARFPQNKSVPQALFYRAECLYERGKKREAAELYAQLVARHPHAALLPDALYALGVAQQETDQNPAAERSFADFLKRFPENQLAAEVLMRRGDARLALGQYDAAAADLKAAAEQPGFQLADYAAFRQAAAVAQMKRAEEAARLYLAMAQRWPKSPHAAAARLAAGKIYYAIGDFAATRAAMGNVSGADAAEAAHWSARSLLRQNKPLEALATADKGLAAKPAGAAAASLLLDRADALYEIPDRRADAAACYAELAAKHPDDPAAAQAQYMAGLAALASGDYSAALAHARGFLRRHAGGELESEAAYVAAESTLQLGRADEAVRLYAELIRKWPQHADAEAWKVRRGLALLTAKKYQEAIATLEPMLAGLEAPALRAEALYVIGSSRLELGQAEAAIASLSAALSAAPRWPELDRAHYRLAEACYAAGDMTTAAAHYQQVVDGFPRSPLAPAALFGLAWARLGVNDYAGAAQAASTLIERSPRDKLAARARYARALARQQLQQVPAAVEDLKAFLAAKPKRPESSDARYALALCQVHSQQHVEAAATLEALLADDPHYAAADKVLYELAWTETARARPAEAAAAFRRLAEKHPASPLAGESLFHAGEYDYQKGDYLQAARAYHAALEKSGRTPLAEKAAHKLGWAYWRSNDWESARSSFAYQRQTWPQGPLAADGTFLEAECFFKQEKFAEALKLYPEVKNPTGPDFALLALLHAGQAAGQLGRWPESLQWLDRALAQSPKSPLVPEILCEQASAQQNLGRTDQALALCAQVIAKTDREPAARAQFMIGQIQFGRGQHAEALKSYFKVLYGYSFAKWQADATYEAARCYEALHKPAQAVKLYQDLLEKHPQSEKAPLARARLKDLGAK